MKRYKKFLLNILLLIGSVCVFFILAEGITRIVVPYYGVGLRLMHQPDEMLGHRLIPNYEIGYRTSEFDYNVKINSEGLRDYEHQKDKETNTFRILVLGDSFTFGLGVNLKDTYPKVLESMLNQNPAGGDKKYEVINAGIGGFGTEHEYIYLKELGNRYKPDLVIVGLYSNDVNDVVSGISTKPRWKKNLIKHFYFLGYLKQKKHLLSVQSKHFQIYQDQYTPQFENALLKTKEYLLKIQDFSNSINARTLIVIVPLCFEIDRLEWEKKGLGRSYSAEFFNKNMAKFSEIFTAFGKMNEIPTLPLLPIFRNSKVRPLYFTYDVHWTREGHRLAAESIFNFLIEKGLYIRNRGKAE